MSKSQALQTQRGQQTSALQDYYKYINPYGVQAEALGHKGLSNSGLSQTNLSRGWANYQNRLGQANTAYQNSITQLDTNMLGYQADVSSQKMLNEADYYRALYEQALTRANRSSGGGGSSRSSSGKNGNGNGDVVDNDKKKLNFKPIVIGADPLNLKKQI